MDATDLEQRLTLSRRSLLQRAAALAALVPAGGLLAACGGANTSTPGSVPTTAAGKLSNAEIATLDWATGGTIDSLDLAKAFSSASQTAIMLGVEPLMQLDTKLQLQPWLASKLEQRDARTLVFTLREDVKFTDGSPLTPADVVFSWERHRDPKLASQVAAYITAMKSIAQTGPHEVTIKLAEPDPLFHYATYFIHIYSAKHGREAGATLGTPEGGVLGTGMYVLEDYKPDTGVTGIRNEQYWGTKPRANRVKLHVIPDPDTCRLAIQQGSIAGSFDPPNGLAAQWNKTADVQLVSATGMTVSFVSFSVGEKPWNDSHVRKAVAYCIDRAGIVKSVLGGLGAVANDLATPTHWAGPLGVSGAEAFLETLPTYAFDVERAKAEMAQSSSPDGFAATIKTSSGSHANQTIALSLKQNLAQIGITLNVVQISPDEYNKQLYTSHAPGIWLATFAPVVPDPIDYYGIALSKAAAGPGGYNTAGYDNPEVDRLLAAQRSQTGKARTATLERIARIVADDVPYAPICWSNVTLGLNTDYGFSDFDAFSQFRPWALSVGKRA